MATLILEDGSRYEGTLFGRKAPVTGEVVFTTGMIGYQGMMTDPAYCGQIVCMTYPLLGNVGINDLDDSSDGAKMRGVVVSELCELPSNWQTKKTLDAYMDEQGVTGLYGVDTRALTRHIRKAGELRGRIVAGEPTEQDFAELRAYAMHDQVKACTCKEAYEVKADAADLTVAVVDYGMNRSLLASLTSRGCNVKVYPADAPAEAILAAGCDAVVFSQGAGDPADVDTENVRALMAQKPAFGMGLGHLLMARAMGGGTMRMACGHHGANQPVRDLARGTCAVTAQSHSYAVDPDKLPAGATVSHLNWNDKTIEGLVYANARSVQFIPEGGSRCETSYILDDFLATVRGNSSK